MARLLQPTELPCCPGCGIALWQPGICPLCRADYLLDMQRQDWVEELDQTTKDTNDPTK